MLSDEGSPPMSSSSTVDLVDLTDFSWPEFKESLLARVGLLQADPPTYLQSYELEDRVSQLRELEFAVRDATSMESLAKKCSALSWVRGMLFLRESRFANDNLTDMEGEVLTYALRGRLVYITEVLY